MPPLIGGRYRPIGEIGRGGMGSVLLVEHVNTGDHLALKVLHKSFGSEPAIVERFRREARAAAKIKSDHVVRVTDADVSEELGGVPFMVMEVLDGEDLRKRLAARGAFPKEQVVGILWQVARALDRAHAIGIVHRDIKPENIFLHKREDGSEIVKILDFGISKMLGDLDASSTQTGTLLGTPYFMAPEQVRNAAITPQTDVWAVGMLAYKLLVGRNYWPTASTGELMMLVLNQPMDPPSARVLNGGLGPSFDGWFFRSCSRDASQRWVSVGEQVAALADALGVPLPTTISGTSGPLPASQSHSGVYASRTQEPGPPATTSSQGPMLAAVAGVVLAVLLVFGAWRFAASRSHNRVAAPIATAVASAPPAAIAATTSVDTSATSAQTSQAPQPSNAVLTAEPATQTSEPAVTQTATASATPHAASRPTQKKTTPSVSKTDDPWAR